MTADVIVNRTARRLRDPSALRDAIVDEAVRAGARVHETHDLGALDDAVRTIAARGTDAVVLAGGDGSHMAGVSAIARAFAGALPPIGFAPGGTVCTIARNLGMRGSHRAVSERVVQAACAPGASAQKHTTHATLRLRDDAGGDRVGFIFGAGLVARFFDAYYARGDRGLLPAAGIAARVFAGSFVGARLASRVLSPVRCTLHVDGEAHAVRAWSLILASVVRDVGLHVRATYRAGEAEQRFHVVASGLSPRGLAGQVPRVLSGRPLHGGPHVDALAQSLRVVFDDEGGDEYVLDGDVMRAREAHVTPGPAIRVVVP